jgi:hypothetical protein
MTRPLNVPGIILLYFISLVFFTKILGYFSAPCVTPECFFPPTAPCPSAPTTPCPPTPHSLPCDTAKPYYVFYENPNVPEKEFIERYNRLFAILPSQVIDFVGLQPHFMENWNALAHYFNDYPRDLYRVNEMINQHDFLVAYSMVRLIKPKTIVEVGSGHSTIALWTALVEESKMFGHPVANLTCIEPHRSAVIPREIIDRITILPHIVQSVDTRVFRNLQSGDILYLDGSHVMQPLGDTIYNFLFILPLLNRGVFVHVHDIFLPCNYPVSWVMNRAYTEQWALAMFLYGNQNWDILMSNNYFCKNMSQVFEDGLPADLKVDIGRGCGGGIWLRKVW